MGEGLDPVFWGAALQLCRALAGRPDVVGAMVPYLNYRGSVGLSRAAGRIGTVLTDRERDEWMQEAVLGLFRGFLYERRGWCGPPPLVRPDEVLYGVQTELLRDADVPDAPPALAISLQFAGTLEWGLLLRWQILPPEALDRLAQAWLRPGA